MSALVAGWLVMAFLSALVTVAGTRRRSEYRAFPILCTFGVVSMMLVMWPVLLLASEFLLHDEATKE